LDDTVRELDAEAESGNGFKLAEYSSRTLIDEVKKALEIYQNKKLWHKLVRNAMNGNFSWKKSALRYEEIYNRALIKSFDSPT